MFFPILIGSRESMATFELLCETFPDENYVLTNREILLEVSTTKPARSYSSLPRSPSRAPPGNALPQGTTHGVTWFRMLCSPARRRIVGVYVVIVFSLSFFLSVRVHVGL